MVKGKGSGSLRQLAKAIGVSHTTVVKAAKTGRLKKSIGRDARGRPYVTDVDLARREFAAGASKAARAGDADLDVEQLIFDLLEVVLVGPARECVRSWQGQRPDEFDPRALAKFLRRAVESGEEGRK